MPKNTSSKYLANAIKRKKEEAKKKKEAGWKSEAASAVNPLNLLGGIVGGSIAAGLTPTKSYDDLARRTARETLKDNLVTMLVPGVGPYQLMKRQGTSIRSPEVQGLKDDYKAEKDKAKNDAKAEKAKAENEKNQSILKETFGEKESGWKSEALGGFNPVNYVTVGGAPGVLAAGLAPTRTMKEQAISDVDTTTANALVPFLGPYNAWKRMGTSIRSPEFLAMVQKHKDLLAEEETAAAAEGEEKEASLSDTDLSGRFLSLGEFRNYSDAAGDLLKATQNQLSGYKDLASGYKAHAGNYKSFAESLKQQLGNALKQRKSDNQQAMRNALYTGAGALGVGGLLGGGLGYAFGRNRGKDQEASKESALKGDQKKIDINKNDKVDAADLAMLRNQKKVVKGEIVSKEAILYLARNKQADSLRLQELIAKGKDVAGQAVNKVQGAMPSIAMGQMLKDPNVQNALGGAALGAGAGGLSYLLSRDKDKSLGKRLLTGATLGGITGGAYNTAKDYFQGPQSNDFVGPLQPAEDRSDFVGPRLPEVDTAYNGNQPVRTNPFKLGEEGIAKAARLFGRRRSSGSSSSRGRGGYGVSTGASSRSTRSSSRGGFGARRSAPSRRPAPVAKPAPAKPAAKPVAKPVSDKGNVSMGRSNTKADKAYAQQMAAKSKKKYVAPSRADLTIGKRR